MKTRLIQIIAIILLAFTSSVFAQTQSATLDPVPVVKIGATQRASAAIDRQLPNLPSGFSIPAGVWTVTGPFTPPANEGANSSAAWADIRTTGAGSGVLRLTLPAFNYTGTNGTPYSVPQFITEIAITSQKALLQSVSFTAPSFLVGNVTAGTALTVNYVREVKARPSGFVPPVGFFTLTSAAGFSLVSQTVPNGSADWNVSRTGTARVRATAIGQTNIQFTMPGYTYTGTDGYYYLAETVTVEADVNSGVKVTQTVSVPTPVPITTSTTTSTGVSMTANRGLPGGVALSTAAGNDFPAPVWAVPSGFLQVGTPTGTSPPTIANTTGSTIQLRASSATAGTISVRLPAYQIYAATTGVIYYADEVVDDAPVTSGPVVIQKGTLPSVSAVTTGATASTLISTTGVNRGLPVALATGQVFPPPSWTVVTTTGSFTTVSQTGTSGAIGNTTNATIRLRAAPGSSGTLRFTLPAFSNLRGTNGVLYSAAELVLEIPITSTAEIVQTATIPAPATISSTKNTPIAATINRGLGAVTLAAGQVLPYPIWEIPASFSLMGTPTGTTGTIGKTTGSTAAVRANAATTGETLRLILPEFTVRGTNGIYYTADRVEVTVSISSLRDVTQVITAPASKTVGATATGTEVLASVRRGPAVAALAGNPYPALLWSIQSGPFSVVSVTGSGATTSQTSASAKAFVAATAVGGGVLRLTAPAYTIVGADGIFYRASAATADVTLTSGIVLTQAVSIADPGEIKPAGTAVKATMTRPVTNRPAGFVLPVPVWSIVSGPFTISATTYSASSAGISATVKPTGSGYGVIRVTLPAYSYTNGGVQYAADEVSQEMDIGNVIDVTQKGTLKKAVSGSVSITGSLFNASINHMATTASAGTPFPAPVWSVTGPFEFTARTGEVTSTSNTVSATATVRATASDGDGELVLTLPAFTITGTNGLTYTSEEVRLVLAITSGQELNQSAGIRTPPTLVPNVAVTLVADITRPKPNAPVTFVYPSPLWEVKPPEDFTITPGAVASATAASTTAPASVKTPGYANGSVTITLPEYSYLGTNGLYYIAREYANTVEVSSIVYPEQTATIADIPQLKVGVSTAVTATMNRPAPSKPASFTFPAPEWVIDDPADFTLVEGVPSATKATMNLRPLQQSDTTVRLRLPGYSYVGTNGALYRVFDVEVTADASTSTLANPDLNTPYYLARSGSVLIPPGTDTIEIRAWGGMGGLAGNDTMPYRFMRGGYGGYVRAVYSAAGLWGTQVRYTIGSRGKEGYRSGNNNDSGSYAGGATRVVFDASSATPKWTVVAGSGAGAGNRRGVWSIGSGGDYPVGVDLYSFIDGSLRLEYNYGRGIDAYDYWDGGFDLAALGYLPGSPRQNQAGYGYIDGKSVSPFGSGWIATGGSSAAIGATTSEFLRGSAISQGYADVRSALGSARPGMGSGRPGGGNGGVVITFSGTLLPTTYSLTVAAASGGSASPAGVTSGYTYGQEVPITATPSIGYRFSNWSGPGVTNNLASSTTVTMNGDRAVVAYFVPDNVTLTVTTTTGGTATGGGTYPTGSTATITPAPATGYYFSHMSEGSTDLGDGDADDDTPNPPMSFVMNSDRSIMVHFSPKQDQAITYTGPTTVSKLASPFVLMAGATSGLPVQWAYVSGPAVLSGSTLTLQGITGTVVLRASQPGNRVWNAAPTIDVTIEVRDAGAGGLRYVGATSSEFMASAKGTKGADTAAVAAPKSLPSNLVTAKTSSSGEDDGNTQTYPTVATLPTGTGVTAGTIVKLADTGQLWIAVKLGNGTIAWRAYTP